MNSTKHQGENKRAAAAERAAFRRAFKYIVGRFPTDNELDRMIPG